MSNKWVDELNTTLWAVQTLTRGPIGETTYALVYHSEVVAPTELALPTPRVSLHNPVANKRMRSLDLDLLEEKRIASRLRNESYK